MNPCACREREEDCTNFGARFAVVAVAAVAAADLDVAVVVVVGHPWAYTSGTAVEGCT